jgi:hypothetical protein
VPAPPAPALPTAKAAFAAIKPKISKSTVVVPLSATIAFPAGVPAARACSGKATLSVTVGKKIVKSASAQLKLIKAKCVAAATLKVKTKLIAGKKFTAAITFDGNATIAKFYAAKSAKSGKFKK